jgi:hypothetical protein
LFPFIALAFGCVCLFGTSVVLFVLVIKAHHRRSQGDNRHESEVSSV